jgi:hypothetical protein
VPERDDDRFGDLGAPPSQGTRAGEKFAELDRREPEEERRPKPPGSRRGSYTWVVGVAATIAIVAAGINSLSDVGGGTKGPPAGSRLRVFAAPSATGPLKGDPNVKQGPRDTTAPNKTPACDVHLAGVVRVCPPFTRPYVITFIVPTGACENFLDRIQRLQGSFPQVNFLAVISGVGKGKAKSLATSHRWTFPVAVDDNLALFNTYRIALCATTVFAYRGGTVRTTKVEAQNWTDATLRSTIAATAARR